METIPYNFYEFVPKISDCHKINKLSIKIPGTELILRTTLTFNRKGIKISIFKKNLEVILLEEDCF